MTRERLGRESGDSGAVGDIVLKFAQDVLSWAAVYVRPFLEDAAPERLVEVDRAVTRLQQSMERFGEQRAACFLGNSGVGKSTLINALVAGRQRILPQGGIGPLTAQATSVRFADRPYFEATYLPRRNLNQLLFGLERFYEGELRKQGAAASPSSRGIEELLAEDDRRDIEVAVNSGTDPGVSDRITAYQKQARLLVQGSQVGDISLPYLLDGLRLLLGHQPRWGQSLADADMERVEKARACIGAGGEDSVVSRRDMRDDTPAFMRELYLHASGFLAPLIKTLEVGWNASSLRDGLVMVDLPGLGVANDEYRAVTHQWVREKARCIVLVVDRSGVREAEAELLRSSGFLNRLLHAVDDPEADPVDLIVAMVKIDLTADDAWRQDRDHQPETARRWTEHFRESCEAARQLAREQLAEHLARIGGDREDEVRGEIQAVISRLLEGTEIHAVSAPQFVKYLAQDDEDRARIAEPSQSGIPQLQAALREVAFRRHRSLEARVREVATDLFDRLKADLELVQAQWEGDTWVESEANQLRGELEKFLEPLRRELHHRQGAFREYLKETLPAQIETLVEQASKRAESEIEAYLDSMESAHWATLRAAVRRGGTFFGARHIDLPRDFSLRFEEPVAAIWARRILASLRKRTSEQAEDYVALVNQVTSWAEEQGSRLQPRLVRALRDKMQADAKQLAAVGKEKVDELRAAVKNELLKRIQGPIRKRCQKFVDDRQHEGAGTKRRILEFFGDLVPLVVEAARPAAIGILKENFVLVEEEIRAAFAEYPDPLAAAAEAMASSHESRLRRSDEERKRSILSRAEAVVRGRPAPPAALVTGSV